MKRNYSRIKLIAFAALIFVLFSLKDLLTEMVGGKIGDYIQTNYGVSTRTLVYIFIGLLLLGFLYAIYEALTANKEPKTPQIQNIETKLEILYDSLKKHYQDRYDNKLDGRFEITLEVNEDWRFDKPATYKFSAAAKVSEAAAAVGKAFDEKGRLLIVGSPGSGKTVLLLKLALGLLGGSYEKDKQIPVIFNLASWRETYENFEDWLIEVLNTGNGLSKDFAKTVLREKKIVFLLDGLDELARNEEPQKADEIRAQCMESLNDYLREGRRTVICCRREEFAAMQKTTAKDAPVSAKVEVLNLTEPDIILALHQAKAHNESRAAAENLEKLIETNETVLEVLATPFYFTTALEVFDKPTLTTNFIPDNLNDLKFYLLKEFVSNKYKYSRSLREFEGDFYKTKKWLKWLADLLEDKQNVSFDISSINIHDLKNKKLPKVILGILNGLYFAVFSLIILHNLINNYSTALFIGLIVGVIVGSIVGKYFAVFFENFITTNDIQIIAFRNIYNLSKWKAAFRHSIFVSLFIGSFTGVLGFAIVTYYWGILFGILSFVLFGMGGGFFAGSIFCLFDTITEIKYFTAIDSPYQRLKAGFILDTFKWTLLVCIGSLLLISFLNLFWELFLNGRIVFVFNFSPLFLFNLLFFGILSGCFASPLFRHLIIIFSLWQEGSIPIYYTTFLDLAADARILEKDGGQWRFRHQNLQEYFAALETGE